jgi:hypothetical protein
MGIDDETRIVLGSLRNKTSPNTILSSKITLEQTQRENIEFDRSVEVDLQQVFIDERENSNILRPVCKFSYIFKNQYVGSVSYPPFRDNLYYANAINNAISATTNPSLPWDGYPQYFEFDFFRTDNTIAGYTQPPNQHLTFVTKSASTYNWNHYISYAAENDPNKELQAIDQQTGVIWNWIASDGIPFIIRIGNDNNERVISFRCVMPHGLAIGEYVQLSFDYFGETLFQVTSLGDEGYGSEEFIFNIDNIGYIGSTFFQDNTGTFKRVIDNTNVNETTSLYYVRKNRILTRAEDAVLTRAGFEQNVFNSKTKSEPAVLTPNNLARSSVKEGSQAYSLSFNVDVDVSDLLDNQRRPVSELFVTTIWKGYFGWTNPLKEGHEFNIPLYNDQPSPWWDTNNILSNSTIPTNSYFSQTVPPAGPFIYQENLQTGSTIYGDFCEFNNFDQLERVISRKLHKIVFNPTWFALTGSTGFDNQLGYYYYPLNPMTIRVFSDYIEEGDAQIIVGVPNYSYYSNLSNSFRWRDLYPFGYVDADGLGVDFPFLNGKHYPFLNLVFRLIPEGTQTSNQFINTIAAPTIDECE